MYLFLKIKTCYCYKNRFLYYLMKLISVLTLFFFSSIYMFFFNTLTNMTNLISISFTEILDTFIYIKSTSSTFSYVKPDNASYYNHNFWDLPWPASEKMTSLIILYLEVSYTILFVFLIVSFVLLETIIVYSSNEAKHYKNVSNINGWESYFSNVIGGSFYPVHFTPEEEHFIDMFVIIIPTLIVLQIILPTLGYLYNEEFLYYDTYVSFDINVIGNQWFWTYEYIIDFCTTEHFTEWNSIYVPSETDPIFITFDSVIKTSDTLYRLLEVDNPLVVPVNTNILFSFTSRDVIHSWALPQMGIKVDCIPGRITHTIFSSFCMGIFYGQCSELCGPLHGFMPICVEVISFDSFFIWILIKYKLCLQDLSVYTSVIYSKEVFSLLCLNDSKSLNSFIDNIK